MRIIGLDVGEKRIGVAKVDTDTKIALPVSFVLVDGTEWNEISRIARLNNTNFFVLGLPRSNEGNETQQTLYVRRFAKTLVEKIPGAKIRFQDESLTSVEAEKRLKARKKNYEKGEIDAEAASIILQDFIEGFKEPAGNQPKSTSRVKKEADKAILEAKKVQDKTKKWLYVSIPLIVVALIVGAISAIVWYKGEQARQRREYYEELERQMKPEVFNFTILPGETLRDIKKKLVEIGYSEAEVDAGFNADYDFDFLKSRPANSSLEGYLLGETHEFYKDSTVNDIIEKFLEGTKQVIEENDLVNKYAARGLSLHDGIILASIVQKESPGPEMATVAQVFLTRLEYGIPLGSDVTVTYALDQIDPDRQIYSNNQAALKIDSCYNTRIYAGLPCGPIASPGVTALLAVASPSDTAYLYFLTGDDGVMYYSYTEYEHNQNAYLHCQELCHVSL